MKVQKLTKIEQSDRKIAKAIEVLSGHHRGLTALRDLKAFLNVNQANLDLQNGHAVNILVDEFFKNHRRDFLKGVA